MDAQHSTAARLPRPAARDQVPEDEQDAFDAALARVAKYGEENPVAVARLRVDGRPYAQGYFEAWTHAPLIAESLSAFVNAVVAKEGLPGHLRGADQELTYFVIGFDSGYCPHHAGHTPNALAIGVRPEALEALADGHEERLDSAERAQVEFIRAVRDGAMTDRIWSGMVDRLGSERGAIEFAAMVVGVVAIHRLMFSFGVPATSEAEWRQLMKDYADGTRNPAAEAQDYVFDVLRRAPGSTRS
jgi:hypothetical protein